MTVERMLAWADQKQELISSAVAAVHNAAAFKSGGVSLFRILSQISVCSDSVSSRARARQLPRVQLHPAFVGTGSAVGCRCSQQLEWYMFREGNRAFHSARI